MLKVLIIEKGDSPIQGFQNVLEKKDYSFVYVKSLQASIPHLKKKDIDLAVVNKDFSSRDAHYKKFIDLTQNIPKMILSHSPGFKGMGIWLKNRLTTPVHMPLSSREFEYHVRSLLKDKELKEENLSLNDTLKTQKEEIGFFEEITKILTSTMNMNKILAAIMRKTKAMIGTEAWSVLLLDEGRKELSYEMAQGKDSKKTKGIRIKIGEGIAGWVAQEGLPVIVPDVSKDIRFSGKIDKLIDFESKSLMCIPIIINNEVIGVLEVVNKADGSPFTKSDLTLLLKLVNHAAMAIERSSLYQKMEELSLKDDVTNLFNTRYLNRAIEIEIERSDRYGPPFTLIFMDIDSFKDVNDNHGHLVGGKVLVEISQLLLKKLRTVDIVARYGGDEFVVVLPQTNSKTGFHVAERLRRAMDQHTFLKQEGYSLRITASFGVATYPVNARSKEELFRIADEAMYKGKFSTKNIVYAAAK
jgi:diguanylate cyclase (GGDEF)-like protein